MEKEQTTIRLPKQLKEQLQKQADKMGYTVKDAIVFILLNYLAKIVQE